MAGSREVVCAGWRSGSDELLDAVRPESAEVVVRAGVDDRGLQVAQRHNVIVCFSVGGNIDFLVGDSRDRYLLVFGWVVG